MLWIGLLMLVLAALSGLQADRADRRIKAMRATETVRADELHALRQAATDAAGPGFFRHRCEVSGSARPGGVGTLRSEFQGVECVWHRHKVTRKYEETYRDADGAQKRRTLTQTVSDFSSTSAFAVEDDTGEVPVHPGTATIDAAEKVLDVFVPQHSTGSVRLGLLTFGLDRGDTTVGYRREEWVIRSGTPLFVHGEASDQNGGPAFGAVREGGAFIVSTRSEAELVRSAGKKALAFRVSGGLTALAGAVLLVFGVLG